MVASIFATQQPAFRTGTPYTIYGSDLLWWHDLQDPTTRFSDFIGTPAVAGDRVQLLMDKAAWQGRTLAQELAAQTDVFGAGTATGTSGYQTYTPASDKWVISRDASGTGSVRSDSITIPAETWCAIEFDFTLEGLGPNYAIDIRWVGGTGGIGYSTTSSSAGHYRVFVKSGSAAGYFFFTMPASGRSGGFANISVKAIPGAHAYQSGISGLRPLLQLGANGAYQLEPDGLDDFMVTSPLDLSSTDKVTVFTAVRKLSDATIAALMELSANANANNGAFGIFAPSSAGAANYLSSSRGTALAQASYTNALVAAPVTNVLAGINSISGDSAALHVNESQVAQSTADQGTGNYGSAYPLYYFRRAGSSLPFQGYFWGAFGVKGIPTAAQIAQSIALLNRYAQAY